MADQVSYIPPGFHTVTPYLIANDGHRALAFYQQAFGAVVNNLETFPDGRFLNAEFRIGDSNLMLGQHEAETPEDGKLPRLSIYVYVPDADALHAAALAAGAQELYPVSAKFYGNREGGVLDPFGITWWIATRVEHLTPAEMARRMAGMAAPPPAEQ
jgi:PhnB protein